MYWDVPRGASYGEKVMRKFKYTIKEEQGIHARPASFLIQEARTYESRITLRVKGKEVDALNIRLGTCIQTLLRGHKYRLFSSSDSVCGC